MPILIIITESGNIENEIEIINSLFNSGLMILHLRKPELQKEKISFLIQQIDEKHRNKIMIHSHFELVYEYKLKGFHLTSDFINQNSDIEIKETINLAKQYKMSISTSVHSLKEIEFLKYNFDYVFLSPIFDSISKKNYYSAFNITDLTFFLKANSSNAKIIALGGINETNIKSVFDCGFHGAALLGAIWKQKNKIEVFKKINEFTALNNNK